MYHATLPQSLLSVPACKPPVALGRDDLQSLGPHELLEYDMPANRRGAWILGSLAPMWL